MIVAGVITEYNPFHLGHAYQLQTIKEELNADSTIVLMSGNIVQRGEFAVLDKWTRSQAAIEHGADLVLELPLIASLQSADFFADWSVRILNRLNIDTLVFGTESLKTDKLLAYVDWLESHKGQVDDKVRSYLSQGYSYAASYQMAIEAIGGLQYSTVGQANHLLGVQYVQSLRRYNSATSVYAIPRINKLDNSQTVFSGSQLRRLHSNHSLTHEMLPEFTYQKIKENPIIKNSDYYLYLKYQILSQSPMRLKSYFGIEHGVENFIYEAAMNSHDYSSMIDKLTSKRWTKASMQRKLMTILLNITKEEWEQSRLLNSKQAAVRILAYNQKGKKILRQQRNNTELDLFSNLKQTIASTYELNLRADLIYSQFHPSALIQDQNTGRFPIQG
ncbi:nucleotidyltransferase family protein [Aerococcaceae bacterium WGS1372]